VMRRQIASPGSLRQTLPFSPCKESPRGGLAPTSRNAAGPRSAR
jgi:hypothetical protein